MSASPLLRNCLRHRSARKSNQFLKYLFGQQAICIQRRCQSTLQKTNLEPSLICGGIVRSPLSDIIIPRHATIDQFLWENVDRWPNHVALECSVTGKKYTYNQLRTLSRRFAESLRRMGLQPGDVLAVMLPNIPDYPIILLGALEAGLIVSPTNPIYTPYELSHQLRDNGSLAIVTLADLVPKVDAAKQEIESKINSPCTVRTIAVNTASDGALPGGVINYSDMISDSVQLSDLSVTRKPDDVALLPYSSGTTGLPKGVLLTHRNIVSNILQAEDYEIGFLQHANQDYQEVIPSVLPFFHIYGLTMVLLRGIVNGAKMVTMPKFEASSFISMLKDYKASMLYAVPPIILLLGNHPKVTTDHLASLKFIVNGAGPIGVNDRDRLMAKSKGDLIFSQGYGLTELSPLALVSPIYKGDFASLVPVKSTIAKVMKLDGTLAAAGEHGEICIRGPQVMRGYHNNPSATKETVDENGYLHTGDIGYYDEDGGFHLVDRLKELIKVQGFQVAPAELEAILRSYPNIIDAAVIGIPDARTGEKPLAFVVKNKESNVEAQALNEFVSRKVAPFKKLSNIIFVDSIPRSLAGKILRRVLKDEYMSKRSDSV